MTDDKKMTEEDLRKFVLDYCNGDVMTSWHLSNDLEMLPMVFLPLALFGRKVVEGWKDDEFGILWEHISARIGSRSINGYPIFMSVRIMHVDDWRRAIKAIEKEQKRRKKIEV